MIQAVRYNSKVNTLSPISVIDFDIFLMESRMVKAITSGDYEAQLNIERDIAPLYLKKSLLLKK